MVTRHSWPGRGGADRRMFVDEVLARNEAFTRGRQPQPLPPPESRHLAVLACYDPRLDDLIRPALGLAMGEAILVRSAGAWIAPTGDPLRSLALAVFMFDVREVLVLGHTSCRMAQFEALRFIDTFRGRGVAREAFGNDDLRAWAGALADPVQGVRHSTAVIRAAPFLPKDLLVSGLLLDDASGAVRLVVRPEEPVPVVTAAPAGRARVPAAAPAAAAQIEHGTPDTPVPPPATDTHAPPPALRGQRHTVLRPQRHAAAAPAARRGGRGRRPRARAVRDQAVPSKSRGEPVVEGCAPAAPQGPAAGAQSRREADADPGVHSAGGRGLARGDRGTGPAPGRRRRDAPPAHARGRARSLPGAAWQGVTMTIGLLYLVFLVVGVTYALIAGALGWFSDLAGRRHPRGRLGPPRRGPRAPDLRHRHRHLRDRLRRRRHDRPLPAGVDARARAARSPRSPASALAAAAFGVLELIFSQTQAGAEFSMDGDRRVARRRSSRRSRRAARARSPTSCAASARSRRRALVERPGHRRTGRLVVIERVTGSTVFVRPKG